MNRLLSVVFGLVISATLFGQQEDVGFSKKNFPDKKEELHFALKAIHHGDELFKEALFYYENEDASMFRNALPYFQKAYSFNPNSAELNYKIGVCVLYTVHNERALSYFMTAHSLNPAVAEDILFYLGKASHFNDMWEEALGYYKEYKIAVNAQSNLKGYEKEDILKEVNKRIQECENGKYFSENPVNVVIQNLGEPINTEFPEYGVVISADESIMYFTSRRPGSTGFHETDKEGHEQNYAEDVYVSIHNEDGTWSEPKGIGPQINSYRHDATVALSPDAQTLLVYKADNHLGGIYHCELEGDVWGHPRKLKHIDTDAHESSACYSPDQQMLFFVSDKKKDSYGGKDIFYSVWDKEKEEWSMPSNLGPKVNTEYDEEAVFMHADGKTLYFSSKGHTTMGGFDVFQTVLQDSVWSQPVNLGYPVNSSEDDVFLVMAANGRHGYYATHHRDSYGEKDIYKIIFLGEDKELVSTLEDPLLAGVSNPVSIHVPEPSAPIMSSETTLLKGVIKDKDSNTSVSATIEITDNETHEVIATYKSNSKTGKYLLTLPSGKNYGITVVSDDYLFHSENLNIPSYSTYKEIFKEIDLAKIDVGALIVLKNIFFDSRESTIRKESIPELERLVELLKSNPSIKIEISGHTDNIGAEDYNKNLSEERAKAVVDYLIKKSVDTARLEYAGFGYSKPISSNETEEGRQLNRRTEFKVISK